MQERITGAFETGLPQGADLHIGKVYPNGYSREDYGDLGDHHHVTRVAVLNNGLRPSMEDIETFLINGLTTESPKHIRVAAKRASLLRARLDLFSESNAFPSSTSEHMSKLQREADSKTEGLSLEEKTAARLAKFNGIQIATDHDGTWSDLKGRVELGHTGQSFRPSETYLTDLIPTSEHAEQLLKKYGREKHFPEIFAATWAPHMEDPKGQELFEEAGRHVPLRAGARQLMDYLGEKDIKITFVSQNFEPVLRGVVKQMDSQTPVDIRAITPDNINALDKSAILHQLAKEDSERTMIFIGDGETDYKVEHAYRMGIISAIFALENDGFDKMLTKHGIPHFTFRDLHDIRVKLEELTALAQEYRSSNANVAA